MRQQTVYAEERTFGTLRLDGDDWVLDVQPQVAMLARRLFERLRRSHGELRMQNTPATCRDLEWLVQRYPLKLEDGGALAKGALRHRERALRLDQVLDLNVPPRQFELALPARDYQNRGATLALEARELLLADDVGVGKTVTGICTLIDPRTRPAMVVVKPHLMEQWAEEFQKFAPDLVVHIIQKAKPYPIAKTLDGRSPDVFITSYYRLAGWQDYFAGRIRMFLADEVQELRHNGTKKFEAAKAIAEAADFRLGLSVHPDTWLDLRGGVFGAGFIGSVQDAWARLDESGAVKGRLGEYETLEAKGVEGRGWEEGRFCWKGVKRFIRHEGPGTLREIAARGSRLAVTDDHSVFVATSSGMESKLGADIQAGDIIPYDDGAGWENGAKQRREDMVEVGKEFRKAVVQVDLAGIGDAEAGEQRRRLGITRRDWNNYRKQGKYGSYLPLATYLEHHERLPKPSCLYLSKTRTASRVPLELSWSDLAYFLGFWLGDGWISEGNRVCFAVSNKIKDEFIEYLDNISFLDLSYSIRDRPGASVEVRCSNILLARAMEGVFGGGPRAWEKRIPSEWLVGWSRADRMALLRGLIDSDGHIRRSERNRANVSFSTTSKDLVASVQVLLRSLGIQSGVHTREQTNGGTIDGRMIIGRRPSYTVFWSEHAMMGRNGGHYGTRRSLSWSNGRFLEARVKSAGNVVGQKFVYDLEMEGHPSFTANGLLAHNSATPIYNYGGEIYNVYDILAPGRLGRREEFNREWLDWQKLRDPKAFGAYLRDNHLMLRRTRKDVGRELPGLSKVTYVIDADPQALEAIEATAGDLARLILNSAASKESRWKARGEFEQLMRQATGIAKAPYVAAFVEMLVENGENLILFGWHRAVYEIWQQKLAKYKPLMYTGSETPAQKEEAKRAFIAGKSPILIMSLRSGAGTDGLQHVCRTEVFGELDWSPGIIEQCTGRLDRDGQLEPVTAFFPVSKVGADPIMSKVIGLKEEQIQGLRDPHAEPGLERLAGGADIEAVARTFLSGQRPAKGGGRESSVGGLVSS